MTRNLIRASLAVALFAGSAYAASDSTTQTVDATVTETISIAIDNANDTMTLVPGTTSTANAVLTVNSTNPFTITAAADADGIKGVDADKLFEFDADAYVSGGKMVGTPLQVSAANSANGTGAGPVDITTAGVQIYSAAGAVSGEQVTATLHQSTPQGTSTLVAGRTYHMVVTYTATSNAI